MDTNAYKEWLLVVAVGLSLVAVAAGADFLVTRGQIKRLHSRLLTWADALKKTSPRQWQMTIAGRGVRLLSDLQEGTWIFTENLAVKLTRLPAIRAAPLPDLVIASVIGTVPALYFFFDTWWWTGVISFPFLVLVVTLVFAETVHLIHRLQWTRGLSRVVEAAMAVPTLSAALSLLAMAVTVYLIPTSILDCNWYQLEDEALVPTSPFLLSVVNFPFDVATIMISIFLLRFVVNHGRFILGVAVLDIVLSAVFSLLLLVTLKLMEGGVGLNQWPSVFTAAITWFQDVGTRAVAALGSGMPAAHGSPLPDLHLLPLLLTTFVPVTLYMGLFVFLSFAKPVMKTAELVFRAVGEKEESVFKQFAFLIASVMAAVKAVYDYITV